MGVRMCLYVSAGVHICASFEVCRKRVNRFFDNIEQHFATGRHYLSSPTKLGQMKSSQVK